MFLQIRWQVAWHSKHFGRAWFLSGIPLVVPLFEANVSHVLHASAFLVPNYSYFMLVQGL